MSISTLAIVQVLTGIFLVVQGVAAYVYLGHGKWERVAYILFYCAIVVLCVLIVISLVGVTHLEV